MAEQTEKKSAKRKPSSRPRRPRPTNAVQITLWSDNAGPLPEPVVAQFEEALQKVQVGLFNEGIRVLSQTNRA